MTIWEASPIRLRAGITATLTTVMLILGVTPAAAGPTGYPVEAGASESGGADSAAGAQRCPVVVIVAARGNQLGEDVASRRHSRDGQFVSNGEEGELLGSFIAHAEQRYRSQHDGASLLTDVHVLGLSEQYHPAEIPVPAQPSGSELLQLIPQAGPITHGVVNGLIHSVRTGISGARAAIEDYEATVDCRPQYILLGYSLGAVILSPQERWLAERGQLAGAVYVGSPFLSARDRQVIGVASGTTGLFGQVPTGPGFQAYTDNRVFYCLPDDLVCDTNATALRRSLTEAGGGPHANYFRRDQAGQLDPTADQLADRLATWIDGTRG